MAAGDIHEGLIDTKSYDTERRKIDMSTRIALLDPDATPFTVIAKRIGGKPAKNPKVSWPEDALLATKDTVNGNELAQTDKNHIFVTNHKVFAVGDQIAIIATGGTGSADVSVVTAINTGTGELTLSATRDQDVNDLDQIMVIDGSNAEGAGKRIIKNTEKAFPYNFCQIRKTAFGVTNTDNATDTYGPSDIVYEQAKKGIEHMKLHERGNLFGKKSDSLTDANGKPMRQSGGISELIGSGGVIKTLTGPFTLTQQIFNDWLADLFTYGSNRKVLFCSPLIMSAIDFWTFNKLQIVPKDKTFGVSVKEYMTSHGTLWLVPHRLLNNTAEGIPYGHGEIVLDHWNMGFALDIEKIKLRTLRATKLETNIQDNDTDGRVDQYIDEETIQLENPEAHGVLQNVEDYS